MCVRSKQKDTKYVGLILFIVGYVHRTLKSAHGIRGNDFAPEMVSENRVQSDRNPAKRRLQRIIVAISRKNTAK